MISRITKSVSVAVKAAFISFEKSYVRNEDLESIMGYKDALTEIPNQKAFNRDKKNLGKDLALVIIDIDNFKNINARLHESGIDAIFHTYAFFIDKASKYVTPVPHPQLDAFRSFTLTESSFLAIPLSSR